MDITYTYKGIEKTISYDIPEKLYLRHDWNTYAINKASYDKFAYQDDPADQHYYSTITTADDVLKSGWVWERYINEMDAEDETIEEISAAYDAEYEMDDDGNITFTVNPTWLTETPVDNSLDNVEAEISGSSIDDTTKQALLDVITAIKAQQS